MRHENGEYLDRGKPFGNDHWSGTREMGLVSGKGKTIFKKFGMIRNICFRSGQIKIDIGTLCGRVVKKDTRSGMRVKFMLRTRTKPWII